MVPERRFGPGLLRYRRKVRERSNESLADDLLARTSRGESEPADQTPNGAALLAVHERTIDELYEVRLILEPVAAEKAAKHRTDADLEAIARAVIQFRIAYELGSGVAEADIQFHQAVAAASGNEVLAQMMTPMSDLLLEARTRTAHVSHAVDNAVAEHAEIARAIEQQLPEDARDAMANHIRQGILALSETRERSD